MPRIAYKPSKNSCCFVPARSEEHIGNSHKLSQLNACQTSPLPLPKGEDEGEGLFFCRSSSANQIARKTLLSSVRT